MNFTLEQLFVNREALIDWLLRDPLSFAENTYRSDLWKVDLCDFRSVGSPRVLASGAHGTAYLLTRKAASPPEQQSIVLKVSKRGDLFCRLLPPVSTIPRYSCFVGDYSDCFLLGCDEFTVDTLVGFLLTSLCGSPRDSPQGCSVVKQYGAALCKNDTIDVMEFADGGDLLHFFESAHFVNPKAALIRALEQIVGTLLHLQERFDFAHGDMKVANVLVSTGEAPMDFVAKISDYGKSSMTVPLTQSYRDNYGRPIERVRVFNFGPFATPLARESAPDIEFDPITREWFYRIPPTFVFVVYARWRHMGIPFYRSFDTYVFAVSLMLQDVFSGIVRSDFGLYSAWRSIWFDDEFGDVDQKIVRALKTKSKKQRQGTGICVEHLLGKRLKCSATQTLYRRIASIVRP